jgi:copper(I)-binding protein
MRVIMVTSLVMTLVACDVPRAEPGGSVVDARITLPAVRGRPGAGYFTVRADARPVRITNVSSGSVQRIELHEMSMTGGVMRMKPLQEPIVPANGELSFGPGGRHAMLFGIEPALKPGDTLALTFNFEGAPSLTVKARVNGPGESH